ncbi:MAG TPA: hypothetical protein ENK28_02215 [Aliiroseovarius sp.]|nr:hypothetical protein [Aliiroseovarius sp.]
MKNSCKNFAKSFAKLLPALAAIIAPGLVAAQQVAPCQSVGFDQGTASQVIRDQRSFANGAVTLALLDLGQPEAGNLYLMLLSPPNDAGGNPQCRLISWREDRGFAQLDFSALTATYDPAKGLTFSIPGLFVLLEEGFSNAILVHLTVNQATGEVMTESELGLE